MTAHEFSRQVDAARTCVCHGWSRARIVEDLPQHDPMPLVGLTEIASAAGVQKPVVATWRTKPIFFPEPVALVGRTPVWWWPDVEAWLQATGRRTDAGWTVEQVNGSPTYARNRDEWGAAVQAVRAAGRAGVAS